jgi:DNA-directed RNA polymerase subunit K/omega
MSNSPSKPLPSKYEIAVPQTYDAFDLSAAKPSPVVEVAKTSPIDLAPKESAQKTRALKPKKTADDWIDSKDETPKVKDKDEDKFEAPDWIVWRMVYSMCFPASRSRRGCAR